MDETVLSLLACPKCGGALGPDLRCGSCAAQYVAPGGIAMLRLAGDARTAAVRDFYAEAPFPGYPPEPSFDWLRARAERSPFARLLDAAIPANARIAEIGCGTGQMSLYLARADRTVIAADLTRASLLVAREAAERLGIRHVQFVETDLNRPGLRTGAFDVVYCSGVLHHTPDPRRAFAAVARLARPGGMIVLGLYNAVARLPLRLRRVVMRLSGGKWNLRDPVLRDRASEPARRNAWLRDQYRHPEEHRHTVAEVRSWFAQNGVEYLRTFPSALLAEPAHGLFEPEPGGWWLEEWLAQIGWMHALGAEGGLFVIVGRRSRDNVD